MKQLRYQESRSTRRRTPKRGLWVFGPQDAVVAAIALLALAWLQWLSHAS